MHAKLGSEDEGTMRLYRPLRIRGTKEEAEVKALFDTGASFTVINMDLAKKIGHILSTGVEEVTLANGKTKLRVLGCVQVSTLIEGSPIDDVAYVVKGLAEEFIIGVKVMEFYEIKLDPANNRLTVGKNYSSFELYILTSINQKGKI